MDDFSEKINQVLSDPGQMAKIMELAKQFSADTASDVPPMPQDFAVAPEQLQRILSLLNTSGGKEECLLNALDPFLSPEKSRKMAKAVRAARMSKIISQALHDQHPE